MIKVQRLRIHRFCLIILCLFSTISCDQVTKTAAREILSGKGTLTYLGGMVRFQYIENPGAFLSLGAQLSPNSRFWIFSIAVSIFLVLTASFLFFRRMSTFSTIALALTVGGGIGNLVDRLKYGQVVDFMNIGIGQLRTGIFNVADVAIMAGVVILLCEKTLLSSFDEMKT